MFIGGVLWDVLESKYQVTELAESELTIIASGLGWGALVIEGIMGNWGELAKVGMANVAG